jgi:hypothetical protein
MRERFSMIKLFNAKDFAKNDPEVISADKYFHNEYAAIIANEKLNALIESWPVVLQYKEGITSHWNTEDVFGRPDNPTHTARLAFIEEIKKECKHEPEIHYDGEFDISCLIPKCKHCRVELQATWSEKND